MQTSSISKKSRNILILNSIITFIFIYFVLSILAFEGFAYKYIISLIVTVILFIIVFIYFVLHSQFQAKRLVEEKKFYLDQEQQSALFIEKILNDYKGYFRAIVKLCEKDSPELIKRFVEKHYLSKGSSHSVIHSSHIKLAQVDELLYAFLINKQKIASLLGVSFIVTPDVNSKTSLSLRQVQLLSLIIDDLIFRQYQAASIEDKHINLTIRLTNDELNCDISSNLVIGEDENTNLKLLDALIQFERSNAVVNLNLKPIKIEIRSQLT